MTEPQSAHNPAAERAQLSFRAAHALVCEYRTAVEDATLALSAVPTGVTLAESPRYVEAAKRRRVAEENLLRALCSVNPPSPTDGGA